MKTRTGKALAIFVAAAMIFSGTAVWAGDEWHGRKGEGDGKAHFEEMTRELGLTAGQKAELAKQREAFAPKVKEIREKMKTAHEALKTELDKASPDKAKLAAIVEDLKNLSGEQIQMRIEKVLQMKKILTPEQFAKMRSVMEKKGRVHRGKWVKKDFDGPEI
ncbi:MAG: Spy/CpxP family protein refolding chaperone [Candidatus Omnitrophica bacterium]|nr:Spy/CpxP family protein refolding chaperone [Candidatus Omnitrophota bacterium]MCM8791292.1 Spy/CpxP family protein refolding chaperone [Candidatus Omnitrophota bacterium]